MQEKNRAIINAKIRFLFIINNKFGSYTKFANKNLISKK